MLSVRLSERLKRLMTTLAGREPASAVLRDERTPTDLRSLTARLGTDGDLIVEGHDLGSGVESVFGYREYEWSVTVAAADIPKLVAALRGRRSLFGGRRRHGLLSALRRRFSGDNARKLEPFLKERGIPYAFWNRIGD